MKENKAKLRLIFGAVVLFIIVFVFILYYNMYNRFDINVSPNNYNLKNTQEAKKYFDFILRQIEPKKLRRFIEFNDAIIKADYTDSSTGFTVIDSLKVSGYQNMFNEMFKKDQSDYDNYPVTNRFKDKFSNIGLYKYFELSGDELYCEISLNNEILIEEYCDVSLDGTPKYIIEKTFLYILDLNGNVDNIELLNRE